MLTWLRQTLSGHAQALGRAFRLAMAVGLATTVAACGGSGGGNIDTAPSISAQPQSVTVQAGASATFSVTAAGTGPLSYQWRRNGVEITGAFSASHTTAAVQAADNGAQYTVVVSNNAGSVLSVVATLTVDTPVAPTIASQPAATSVVAPAPATFSVQANGTAPLAFQWRRNGVDIAGATGDIHTTAATTVQDDGAQYSVVVSNAGGSVTSADARLTVQPAAVAPTIVTAPAAATVNEGQTASFSVVAAGTAPLAYQWQRDGSDIGGANGASYTTPVSVAADDGARFAVVVSNAVGSVTSTVAGLSVTPAVIAPGITAQPASASVTEGMTASFNVVASGSTPTYQWRRNGVALVGATAASHTTPVTTLADSGAQYTVVVSNTAGSVTSLPATLTVGARPVAPTITQQPAPTAVTAGATASFSVAATGTAPLAYQWRRNGINLSGATAASYTTPATVLGDSGAVYTVRVSNAVGAVLSTGAALTVNAVVVAPTIASQPAATTAVVGETATFSVAVNGTAPFTYQWRRGGTAIVGATAASYTTPALAVGDDGASFSVVVGNAAGSVTSSAATLTVVDAWAGIREDGGNNFATSSARAVTTDGDGNVVIAGVSSGAFPAFDPAGQASYAFVAKYSRRGVLQWAHKFPTTGTAVNFEEANGVAVDSGGSIIVTGATSGTFPGQVAAGELQDVAILKYDPAGNLLWARQVGTAGRDTGRAVAVDAAGNVFVAGSAGGPLPLQPPLPGRAFLAKYDSNGARLWIRQWGGGDDAAHAVALDAAGNAYVAGRDQYVSPTGYDAFVVKFTGSGDEVWFRPLRGGLPDFGFGVAVSADGSTVYTTGRTNSDYGREGFPGQPIFCCVTPDAFVARLNGDGTINWIQNLSSQTLAGPTYYADAGTAVTTDASGSVAYLTGYTEGVMAGQASLGARDIFVARYVADGTLDWVRQYGADIPAVGARNDNGLGIALDAVGDLFVVGDAFGSIGTPNPYTNRADWFVMKLRPADGTPY